MAYHWVLILTIQIGSAGAAIDHIEFVTRDACEQAKYHWLNSHSNRIKKESNIEWILNHKEAICVSKRG